MPEATRRSATEQKKRFATYSLSASTIRRLQKVRVALAAAASPLDLVVRRAYQMGEYPPPQVRRQVGTLVSQVKSGAEFAAYLKVLGNLSPRHQVLDIGCGFGLIGLELQPYLRPPGRYVGVDVNPKPIRWAQKRLASPTMEFHHVPYNNDFYNPGGGAPAPLAFPAGSFDVVLMKSVFTHLRPDDTEHYLSEIQRLLKPGGRALVTFFVLDEGSKRHAEEGKAALQFPHGDDRWAYASKEVPELATAYHRPHLDVLLAKCGLRQAGFHAGSWRGGDGGLSFQDLLVLEAGRPAAADAAAPRRETP